MANRLGDSMFIGETSDGVESPVFFDPHTPIYNSLPPGLLITGSPGGGKTFCGMTLATISAISGKTTIVVDPKGDFINLINLEDEIGKVTIWNLGQESSQRKSAKGILDPFKMGSHPSEIINLVISTIDIFCGGLDDSQITVLSPIIKDVINSQRPSLSRVIDELRSSKREVARDLGTKLDLISNSSTASLCFASRTSETETLSLENGLTIITLVGLELPQTPEEAKQTQYRFASGLLYLVTNYIRRVMNNDETNIPKTLLIDEVWQVISSEQGANIIKSVALLGRSKKIALILITQNTSHLENLDIETTISTRIAFRTVSKEAESIVKSMELPENEGYDKILVSLNNGECLMKDYRGRVATVQISNRNEAWNRAFNTNPIFKMQNRSRQNA